MKKKLCALFSLLLISLFSISPVHAADADLKQISINAYLHEDGSAHIEEVWDIDIDQGTEVYKVFDHMGDSQIQNFKVRDEKGNQYQNIGEWDVDVSKDEKDGKCGLVIDGDRYEMCFGIGEYGLRQYSFEYDVTNFVQQYQNDQGFNYAFFSDMAFEPQYVKITLEGPMSFNEDNANIWAFGYYGNVLFEDGKVVMETSQAVPEGAKMQLLMRIDNGTFKNAHQNNQDFQDILDDAKEGSDYDDSQYEQNGYYNSFVYKNESGYIIIFSAACVFAIVGVILAGAFAMSSKGKKDYQFSDHQPLKRNKEDINMFRDIPCDKNVFEFYYLSRMLGMIGDNDKSGLIAAIILKWIQQGYIEFEKEEVTHMFVFKKDGYSIDLKRDIPVDHPLERKLLSFFKLAAGDNQVLETKEFERWCGKNYERIEKWFDSIDDHVKASYQKRGLYSIQLVDRKAAFGRIVTDDVDTYDVKIREEMEHILGFEYFLKEMSLIDEKEVIEVKLWEEYLIFASILGLADKVEEQLGRLCPTFNEQSDLDTIYTMHMVRTFARSSMYSAMSASQASRSSGFGGGSSFGGGGGGFSGGGGGGIR